MKNKVFTVTKADLDTHGVIEVDSYLDVAVSSPTGNSETRRFFPRKVRVINTTGLTVKANIISSDDEYYDYVSGTPSNYQFFSIFTGTSETFTTPGIIPSAYKILVQAPSGVATVGMDIECIGYQPRSLS